MRAGGQWAEGGAGGGALRGAGARRGRCRGRCWRAPPPPASSHSTSSSPGRPEKYIKENKNFLIKGSFCRKSRQNLNIYCIRRNNFKTKNILKLSFEGKNSVPYRYLLGSEEKAWIYNTNLRSQISTRTVPNNVTVYRYCFSKVATHKNVSLSFGFQI